MLFEDSAALLGLLVAFLGVYFADRLNNPYFDGAASVMIGILLSIIAVLLAYETKGLLVGEAADTETLRSIRQITEMDAAVEGVSRILTMHFGPNTILVAMEVQFNRALSAAEVEKSIDRIEEKIRSAHPTVRHIFIESDSLPPKQQQKTSAVAEQKRQLQC